MRNSLFFKALNEFIVIIQPGIQAATHSLLKKTQPDAHFTKVIDGKEIIVNVFFSSATETMQQKIERMLRMDIFNKLKEMD